MGYDEKIRCSGVTLQVDVKEAKVIEDHPQWDLSDTEDEANNQNEDASNDSDYSTDDDDEYDD